MYSNTPEIYCPACGTHRLEAAGACSSCGRPSAIVSFPGETVENKSWFGFCGRISRKEYWLHYALPLSVIPILAAGFDSLVQLNGVLSLIVALVLVIPSLAGSVKRAHDRGRSGWFLLVCLVPVVGSIWFLVEIGFLRGTDGPNRFGRDPRQAALPYGMAIT